MQKTLNCLLPRYFAPRFSYLFPTVFRKKIFVPLLFGSFFNCQLKELINLEMGITGLLPLLKKASNKCNVRKFSGCTAAIDGYSWLHKGAFGCAAKLGKGEPTTAYVTYCIKYINVLLSHNIKPVVVLDGRNLPSKSETEKKRRAKREENRRNAKEFLRKGMNKEAWECFTKCVDVTPAMARELIKVLREMKIDYIISPYEADAQLAYLARNKIVDLIITEDSDLVLFGCPKIFFKMNINGDGVLFDQSKLAVCMGMKPEQFEFERFRWMCIISGCDYLASLPGVGLGRAKKLLDQIKGHDIRKILKSVPKCLKLDIEVPEEYIQGFFQAENTFLYQIVFDTLTRRLVPLTAYPADVDPEKMPYAGSYVDKKLALDMALGNVDIHTLNRVDDFDPMRPRTGYGVTSIWSPDYTISATPRVITARDMKKNTIHSSTIGMQATVSVKSVIAKAKTPQKIKSEIPEIRDEELFNLYGANDETIKSESESPMKENPTKRMRLSTETSEDSDNDFVPEKSQKKKNPFLKVKKSKQENEMKENIKIENDVIKTESSNNPVCLIERNKVYEENPSKVIVKSQYFRNTETFNKNPSKSPKANFDVHITISPEEKDLANTKHSNSTSEDAQDSQLTIYSGMSQEADSQKLSDVEESSQSPQKRSRNVSESDSVQSLSPDILKHRTVEKEELPSTSDIRSRLRSSPRKPATTKNPKTIVSKWFGGPCHRVGLSKTAIKKDPKQKTISSMFSLQQKPKI